MSSVEYHAPRDFGTCDDCGHPFKRASYLMPDGDDVCGRCYGVRKGYIGGGDRQ